MWRSARLPAGGGGSRRAGGRMSDVTQYGVLEVVVAAVIVLALAALLAFTAVRVFRRR